MTDVVIGVDVGGTFTDAVVLTGSGRLHALKVPSDSAEPERAVWKAAEGCLALAGAAPETVKQVAHGTTVGTNALVQRRGAHVGILMTSGFEDTLAIGRCNRPDNYDLGFDGHTPAFLAPRHRRKGIAERMNYDGTVLVPLDEDEVTDALAALVEREEIEALAVCFLFSFVNPVHELRVRELATSLYPELSVSLSCEVNPEIREYERLCATGFDAYVRPAVATYLDALGRLLRGHGIRAPLQVMESGGGIVSAGELVRRPVRALLSGPAAGVVGACHVASEVGRQDIISVDIGGTSCDVSMALAGRPLLSRDGAIAGFPLRLAMVDVTSIGAGGGSEAWFDRAGGLHVGPESAGATPGPACYGKGGKAATATDASVVLGYLSSDSLAGGALRVFPDLAEEAMADIARKLKVSVHEAAWGIHRILNASMTDQIRLMSIGRGHDPRRCTLVALGGAGPVHACALASEIGIGTVIVPQAPGVLCAYGLLHAAIEHHQTTTFSAPLESIGEETELRRRLRALLEQHDQEGHDALRRQGVAEDRVVAEYSYDLRYAGQSYELNVELPSRGDALDPATCERLFSSLHEEVYGHARNGHGVELVNLRTVHRAWPQVNMAEWQDLRDPSADSPTHTVRTVYFDPEVGTDTPVYERAALRCGWARRGPAIIEQPDTTTVVPERWHVSVDQSQHLVLEACD